MKPAFAEEFRKNLYSFFIIRFFFFLALFLTHFLFPFMNEDESLFERSSKLLLIVVFIFIFFNIISLMYMRFIHDRGLPLFTYLQFFFEVLFWCVISFFTGGIQSPYLYVLMMTIMFSGIILMERGVVFTTILSFLLLLLQGLLMKTALFNELTGKTADGADHDWSDFIYRLSIFFFFFVLTGWIASFISRRFRNVNRGMLEKEHFNKMLRERFLSILVSVDTGIVIVESDAVVFTNNYAEQLDGDIAEIVERMRERMHAYRKWNEIAIDGRFYNYIVLRFLEDQTVIMFSDITEVKERERKNERMERMAAIGKLTASIAHEIKNPLASLIGATEIIANDEADDLDRKQLLRIVRREGGRVKKMLDDLFKFTSERSMETTDLHLDVLVADIIFLLGNTHRHISFTSDLPDMTVVGNEDRLREVFMNIFQNSIEAMEKHGTITVSGESAGTDSVRIVVQDEGGGLSAEVQDKVFDPFFSTKKRGTGLGLALVYKIVTMHNGTISISNEGAGVRVITEFPGRMRGNDE